MFRMAATSISGLIVTLASKPHFIRQYRSWTGRRLLQRTIQTRSLRKRRRRSGREEVQRHRDDGVDGQKLDAFVPVRLPIHDEIREDRDAKDDGEHLERREDQIERI